ncbi:hypothetical protein SAMN04487988_10969 [Algoriphagus hitonicola]|uniref:Uncharacterized protein n=1 Tax=Algoriphagus hitonicola TaxID=435880 RepID=A0A1I2VBR8_9BACT|nr:hypothetical protein SAMN04487988_10969 [Algoriphagus hitonicola]
MSNAENFLNGVNGFEIKRKGAVVRIFREFILIKLYCFKANCLTFYQQN